MTFRAHFHFRLLCKVILSSSWSFFMRSSTSCVDLLIQAVQGSITVMLSSPSSSRWSLGCVADVLLSTSLLLSVSLVLLITGWAWVVVMVWVIARGCGAWWSWRRGECRIILSICRCVRRSRFSSSIVNVQASHPYKMVGVTVPWNKRSLSFRAYLGPISSCLSVKIFFHANEILLSTSVLCGSWKDIFQPRYLVES